MNEIQTESFCERCGSRYSFESARPRVHLKSVKALSRGLKAFVLSDDTSIEEAMAAARNQADREATAHQLEAFHKTFNFCLSCRQYTCPNCWNDVEARCLSCAPLASPEAPAAIDLFPAVGDMTVDGEAGTRRGSTDLDEEAWPALDALGAGLAAVEPEVEPEMAAEPVIEAAPVDAVEPEIPLEAAPVAVPRNAIDKAAAQTVGLLKRFRLGQNLDAELDAYERRREDEADLAELGSDRPTPAAATEPSAAVQPEIVAVESAEAAEPVELEMVVVGEEPLPVAAPEPVEAATTPVAEEPLPTIAAAEPTEPDVPVLADVPVLPVVADVPVVPVVPVLQDQAPADLVEQPTWRVTDTDETAATPPEIPAETLPEPPVSAPHWPPSPQWPRAQSAAAVPFLGRPPAAEGGIEALWAASNQELVTAPPTPGRVVGGIRPCISCGLSLSANARFCRRCGALQGG